MRAISSSAASPRGFRDLAAARPGWPARWDGQGYRRGLFTAAWAAFTLVNLDLMVRYPRWETIPFHLIWAALAVFYGFRPWKTAPTLVAAGAVMAATAAGLYVNMRAGGGGATAAFAEDPLLAMVFFAMVWHTIRRRMAAERSRRHIATKNEQLLADQRRFLQDAAHQLKTPITIALGHAELLSGALAARPPSESRREATDVAVIIGELNQLRRISERLLVIAAAGDPEFLHPEPVALDGLVDGLLTRWRPAADRLWRPGAVAEVTVLADRERLSLALDALIENAVHHTGPGDVIELSVATGPPPENPRLVVTDSGSGIDAADLPYIFDRFRGSAASPSRGTGLGLALVDAVARAHGGTVTVRSQPGRGSEFTLALPASGPPPDAASGPGPGEKHMAAGPADPASPG